MTRVLLDVITMAGAEYALWDRSGWTFPHDELRDGEAPADAARRVVEEWSGTTAPKLELVDFVSTPGTLRLVFRALLTSDPSGSPKRLKRMELPEKVGALTGKYVEESLKTSLAYKLTRQ